MACIHTTINVQVLFSDNQTLVIRDSTTYGASVTYLNAIITPPDGIAVTVNLYPTYTQGEAIEITASTLGTTSLVDGIYHIQLEIIATSGKINCCNIYALNLANLENRIADEALADNVGCSDAIYAPSIHLASIGYAARIKFKLQQFDHVTTLLNKANELQSSVSVA